MEPFHLDILRPLQSALYSLHCGVSQSETAQSPRFCHSYRAGGSWCLIFSHERHFRQLYFIHVDQLGRRYVWICSDMGLLRDRTGGGLQVLDPTQMAKLFIFLRSPSADNIPSGGPTTWRTYHNATLDRLYVDQYSSDHPDVPQAEGSPDYLNICYCLPVGRIF